MGIFITGPGFAPSTNIATVPSTSIPICANSINCGAVVIPYVVATCAAMGGSSPYCAYYVNNSTGTTLVYDGLTTMLTAHAAVSSCAVYHLKIAIADATDEGVDSGVFLESHGFTSAGNTISGPNPVCVGTSGTFTDPAGGGTWSSSATAVATVVTGTGVVTGVSAGTATITYTLSAGCYITKTISVVASTPITGPSSVCTGGTITLSDATAGGTWTSSNTSIATVVPSTGVVSGVAAGSVTISYSVGTCVYTHPVTVVFIPGITGTLEVCAGGGTTTLSDSYPGGSWSSGSPSIATVGATTGVVTGVTAGTTIITYSVPSLCSTTATVIVNPLPAAISGTLSVCLGENTTLTDGGGGTWSSSNTTIATIGLTSGVVHGVAVGTATITYTLPTGCQTTATFAVNPLPSAISGSSYVCEGGTSTLTDAGGGTWSSSNTTIATVGLTTGVVHGVALGTATITYTLPTGCITTATITVITTPPPITGTTLLCVGHSVTMVDTGADGTWSSSNTLVATINTSTGHLTGIGAGTATITYANPCGIVTIVITVYTTPSVTISASFDSICAGDDRMDTLVAVVTGTGGVPVTYFWISPYVIGCSTCDTALIMPGFSPDTTWTYTVNVSNGACSVNASITVKVNPLPSIITGDTSVCVGATTALSDSTVGGTWSSSNTAVATVGLTSGIVTGIVVGTTTITYTLSTGCFSTINVAVNVPPAIEGDPLVCQGSTITLYDPSAGGTWSSANTSVATVGLTTGIVTGVSADTVTIFYTTSCGTVGFLLTVDASPVPITGPDSVAQCRLDNHPD